MQKASCAKQSLANEVLTELPIPTQPSLMLVSRARLSPGESLARKTSLMANPLSMVPLLYYRYLCTK